MWLFDSFEQLQKRPSTIPLVMSCLVVLLVAGFTWFADEMLEGDLATFDSTVSAVFRASEAAASPIGPPWLQEAARDITALGSFSCLGLLVLIILGHLLLMKQNRIVVFVAVAVFGGAALSTVLKMSFNRPRPDLQHAARVFTASFPSGHAMLSAVTFLTLGALLTRLSAHWRLKAYFMSVAIFLTVIVGVSRVYLGVHYPSDVVGGWCVGAAWALLCSTGALYFQHRGKLPAPSLAGV